jgi:hypothetical protein
VYSCLLDCSPSDVQCQGDCFGQGTEEAQQALNSMLDCLDQYCGEGTDPGQFEECAEGNCGELMEACFASMGCPLTGGGCPEAEACYPAPGGSTACFPSNGKGAGSACDPDLTGALDCADGLLCLASEAGGSCLRLCLQDAGCPEGEACAMPIMADSPDLGVCLGSDATDEGCEGPADAAGEVAAGEETPGPEDLPVDVSAPAELGADAIAPADLGGVEAGGSEVAEDAPTMAESPNPEDREAAASGGGCQLATAVDRGALPVFLSLALGLASLLAVRAATRLPRAHRQRNERPQ